MLMRQSDIKKHCLLEKFVRTDCGEAALITLNKTDAIAQNKGLTSK